MNDCSQCASGPLEPLRLGEDWERWLWAYVTAAPASDPMLTPVVSALQEIDGLRQELEIERTRVR